MAGAKKKPRPKTKPKKTRRGRGAVAPPARPAKLRAASKPKKRARAKAPPKKRAAAAAPKKRAAAAPKKAAKAASKKRAASPKKRASAAPTEVPKKTSAASRDRERKRRAVERARKRFLERLVPNKKDPAGVKADYNDRRQKLIDALKDAGHTLGAIRSILGWITRRRESLREDIAMVRIISLETMLLDATAAETNEDKRRNNWQILRTMMQQKDERYVKFIDSLKKMGTLNYREMKNEWFSPKVIEA